MNFQSRGNREMVPSLEDANSFPFCLYCPASSLFCRVICCSKCSQPVFLEEELIHALVSSGDTCFLRCYGWCSGPGPDGKYPLNLNHPEKWIGANTPLHFAVSEEFDSTSSDMSYYYFTIFPSWKRKAVDFLLANGADPTIRNRNGKAPFELIKRKYVSDDAYEKLKVGHEEAMVMKKDEEQRHAEWKEREE